MVHIEDELCGLYTSGKSMYMNASGAFISALSNGIKMGSERFSLDAPSDMTVWIGNKSVATFVQGKLSIYGDLTCTGAKNRIVSTQNHGAVSMNAYETAGCWFGDIGEGEIGEDGLCTVALDDVFIETLAEKAKYQVFLQSYGEGAVYVSQRDPGWFTVSGPPGLRFAWEVKLIA